MVSYLALLDLGNFALFLRDIVHQFVNLLLQQFRANAGEFVRFRKIFLRLWLMWNLKKMRKTRIFIIQR